ncbi:porin family protein [Algoriphagus chordae]|uniref:Outer membrane protein with beta-barrel domain n=1 Tax=Algoriphagus chordae TaxID=237019 RepID=A0A2W7R417_9BACT|nr:porin family protein [Algoriphagus chordae]PZX55578.1 outer membrane protein with beta-barrel domain [Algoriphagus chordae]
MKKYIVFIVLMCAGYHAQSQVLISLLFGDKLNSPGLEFGLEGGANFSQISGMESSNRMPSFNLGFYFDIRINDPWYIHTGLLVKSKLGTNKLSAADLEFLEVDVFGAEGDYNQELNYFIVPILAKYKLKNNIYFEAGPQLGLLTKSWVEFNSDVEGEDARIRQYNRDMVNRLDAGATAGMGYQLLKGKGMTLGIKYYQGFVNVYKERSGTKNSSLFLMVNIPIGAAKVDSK